MSYPNDYFTYQNLRQNLPQEPAMPSAPTFEHVQNVQSIPDNMRSETRREEITPLFASTPDTNKSLLIETQLKKTQLKKEQLIKERQLMEEEFRVKEMLLDAEMKLAIATVVGDADKLINSTLNNVGQIENDTKSFNAQKQRIGFDKILSNASSGIEKSVKVIQPVGLEQLSILDEVAIRQLESRPDTVDESYELVAPGDVVILRAVLSFELLHRYADLAGYKRVIKVDMFDAQANELINFKAGSSLMMEVFVNGKLACLVRRKPTFSKPMLMLHDSVGKPVLKIKGPSSGCNRNVFEVQTIDKFPIGSVDKCPHSPHFARGYVPSGYTVVKFPLDLDVRVKAAILASSFLITNKAMVKYRKHKMAVSNGYPCYLTSD